MSLGLALALVLLAQSHPCEQPAASAQTIPVGVPQKLQLCQPVSDNAEAVIVVVDETVIDLLPVTAVTGPSVTGLAVYETGLFLSVGPGAHSLRAATYNRNKATGLLQVGPQSAPLPFVVVDETPLPAAPIPRGLAR